MKKIHQINIVKSGVMLVLALLLSIPCLSFSQSGTSVVTSYNICKVEFAKPVQRMGSTRTSAWAVHLIGNFEGEGGRDFALYIGNEMIREWGGTRKGLYFYIYTEAQFQKINGLIQCKLKNGTMESLGKSFSATSTSTYPLVNYADFSGWLDGP